MAGLRTQNRLNALAVEKQRRPGIYADGAGLSLVVTDVGVKRLELRVSVGGRRRQLGLGLYPSCRLKMRGGTHLSFDVNIATARGHRAAVGRWFPPISQLSKE